ncbi:hypothetical protein BDR26DRAFT_864199 [Obelidium mucronatum]|nr:hypothetical protein BDR26DRAFT_864199 [Obelidium mucronatum]
MNSTGTNGTGTERTPLLTPSNDDDNNGQQQATTHQKPPVSFKLRCLSGVLFVAIIALVSGVGWVLAKKPTLNVSVERVVAHLTRLQEIARENGGSRSVAQSGFKASVDYVVGTLKNETTLKVWTESLWVFDQVDAKAPTLRVRNKTFTPRIDFMTATYSGSGSLSFTPPSHYSRLGPSSPTRPSSQDLCTRVAYAISVLGAKAVIVSTSPVTTGYPRPLAPSGRLPRTCTPEQVSIFATVPILSLSQQLSWELTLAAGDELTTVDLEVESEWKKIQVWNVLAESGDGFQGNHESIAIYGCHLDSVRAGPGVNDDGSGAMATLELAVQYSKSLTKRSVQKVRFAWWAAEEIGLLGSKYHVETLAAKDPKTLAFYKLNIDTDMIASPNYVRGVWDGRSVEDVKIKKAATVIQAFLKVTLKSVSCQPCRSSSTGVVTLRPFMEHGIPSWWSVANMVLDPNYHQPADTVESLRGPGRVVLEQNLKALAHSVRVFALEKNIDAFLKGR